MPPPLPQAGPAALASLALLMCATAARAQDIEPRAFSNAPVGVNFLVGGYAYTRGGLAFDSSSALSNPELQTSSALLGYGRVLDFWGSSGKVDVVVPYMWLSGSALYRGQTVDREVDGFGDPRLRVSVNLYGAPSLTLPEFRAWKQDLILGASFQVTPPLGRYDPSRLINLGGNRWTFRPTLGASQALGPLTLELAGGVSIFTANNDFYGGNRRTQDPIWSMEGHAIYAFANGMWASVDGTWFSGGRTDLNGEPGEDLQRNWRLGTTFSVPFGVRYSVKLYASTGVSARTGNTYDLLGVALQYRWGAGL